MKRLWTFGAVILLVTTLALGIWARPEAVSANDGNYPYAAKPCVWAPYTSDGAGLNWCPDYDFGDQANDASFANVLSPYGYYYRNCTDYTAWKVSTLGVAPEQYKGLGNAKDWAVQALRHGLSVDDQPAVGSVGVRASGKYGHTAFVEAVDPSGLITVSQYNYGGDGNYSEQSGTAASMGLTSFVHFEAYEQAPTVTVSASVATTSAPAAAEPVAPSVAHKQTEADNDVRASSEIEEEPADTPKNEGPALNPPSQPAHDEEPPAPAPIAPEEPAAVVPQPQVEVVPEKWQSAPASPPSEPMQLTSNVTEKHEQTAPIASASDIPSSSDFSPWSLVGLAGVVMGIEALPLRALSALKRR